MENDKLQQILDSHEEWLRTRLTSNVQGKRAALQDADLQDADLRGADLRDADLRGADLQDADLRDADLRGADLRDADLQGADLQGAYLQGADLQVADLDFSCLPLWCGSLSAHFDDRQLKQIAYHLVKAGLQSKNASEDTKKELSKLIDFANGFHRVQACGLIEPEKEESCVDFSCVECVWNSSRGCDAVRLEWLDEEYREPEDETDWSKVPVDTPISVKSHKEDEWIHRHFAKYANGKIYAWDGGMTSFTAYETKDYTYWEYAKLAEVEK